MKWSGAKGKDFKTLVDKALAVSESAKVNNIVDATTPASMIEGLNKKIGQELLDDMFDVHRHQFSPGEPY